VLGFDIYGYSSNYKKMEQSLIPFVFNLIHELTIVQCLNVENFIFQNEDQTKITKRFISTGDGGFQILDTPLHAIVFLVIFSFNLRQFNSYHLFPKLRQLINEINIRYVITTGDLYHYYYQNYDNYYGYSIIKNSRILSTDKLNRLLIDHETYDWFMKRINGVENLVNITMMDIAENISEFNYLDFDKKNYYKSFVFNNTDSEKVFGIKSCKILKLHDVKAKSDNLNIYNLFLEFYSIVTDITNGENINKFTISIGNINAGGIE
jgi:hypothetical protein